MKPRLLLSSVNKLIHKTFYILVSLSFILLVDSCKIKDSEPVTPEVDNSPANKFSAEVATTWAELQLLLTKRTAGYTPPVASRAYGYAGLVMYESVVAGLNTNQSLAGQLSTLATLPKIETGKDYNFALSANAAQAYIMRALYAETAIKQAVVNKIVIDSLEVIFLEKYKIGVAQDIVDRSVKYGQDVATAIFEWSKTDGGHEGYKRNFPATYVVPVFAGAWQTTENGQKIPMQPTWGDNRTFVPANTGTTLPVPITFSTSLVTPYFSQYYEVYNKNKSLTETEKEIAVWWADNPGETFTPPGHSYAIANIAVKKSALTLGKATEVFARTGITVADAFISCWKCKFKYMNERPYTMVRRVIDANWKPFWPAPPFPGFPSGHATQSGAVAVVLTDYFGENYAFTDDVHVGRVQDASTGVSFKARTFTSFNAFATESAASRFYGGIHTRQDNEVGLSEGRKVGKNVVALHFKK